MRNLCRRLLQAAVLLCPAFASGCINPVGMGFFTPVPMQPWVADRIEQRLAYPHDNHAPVLPPIPPGHRPYCEDPPEAQEINRVMTPVTRGVPYIYEEFRDDVEFTVEKLVDKVDPPRFLAIRN